MSKRPNLALALILLLLSMASLAACDGGTSPTATPITPATTPMSFVLETSGTIAGIRQTLMVPETRNATFKDGDKPEKSITVSEQQYADLIAQVQRADFFNLQDRYDSETVSDDKYYELTVTQGTQSKTVTVAEIGGQDLAPLALRELITLLVNIPTGGANS